jgi:hypothetical protein
VVAVPDLRQGGGHRLVGQSEPQQGLVEGPAPVPLQELEVSPGGGGEARGQRVADDQAGPALGGQRGQVPPRRLLGQVVDGLDGHDGPLAERGRALVAPARPRAEQHPVVADLALLHLRLEQLEQLVRGDGVHARVVQQPQVDRLQPQPPQRPVKGLARERRRPVVPRGRRGRVPRPRGGVVAEGRCHRDLVAVPADGLPEQLLGPAVVVAVGGLEVAEPQVEGGPEQPGGVLVGTRPLPGDQRPHGQPDLAGNEVGRADAAVTHSGTLLGGWAT